MNRLFLTLLLLALALPSYADRVYVEGGTTRDGDDGGHYRLFSGYRYRSGDAYEWELEMGAGVRNYWENIEQGSVLSGTQTTTEKERFDAARLALRGTTPRVWRYDLRLEQLLGDEWEVLLGAATVSARPNEDWYIELFAERELVDTVQAIRAHNRIDTYGISADYTLNPSLVLVATLLQQEFSDGNRSQGGSGRLVYYPHGISWLHLQLKGRLLDAEQTSATYFSPDRLQEYFLLFGITTPFANDDWIFGLLAGPGTQIIEPFDSAREEKDAYLGEINLRGWFSDHVTLESNLGCSSAVSSEDTDAYCYGHLHLGYAW